MKRVPKLIPCSYAGFGNTGYSEYCMICFSPIGPEGKNPLFRPGITHANDIEIHIDVEELINLFWTLMSVLPISDVFRDSEIPEIDVLALPKDVSVVDAVRRILCGGKILDRLPVEAEDPIGWSPLFSRDRSQSKVSPEHVTGLLVENHVEPPQAEGNK